MENREVMLDEASKLYNILLKIYADQLNEFKHDAKKKIKINFSR